jgi:TatD DNase family protein
MLIDTHAHLGHSQFQDDLAELLQRARAAGVMRCVMPAVDVANAQRLYELAALYPMLHACAGIHPCDVDQVPRDGGQEWLDDLRLLAQREATAAVGEIGLDYYHPPQSGFTLEEWRAHQAYVLRCQLDLAAELGLNTILHARECHAELVEEVRAYSGRLRCVFHCFTGTLEQAQEVVAMGHLVSFTGVITYKKSEQIQLAAAGLPAGSFMLETDSPYLSPVPHRGRRCEPAFVGDTAQFIAKLRGESVQQLAEHTGAAARAFFRGIGEV